MMELNEITSKLPPHLLQFVVDQPYHQYTPVDQAVWRYVMRKNSNHLKNVAHESYLDGLKKAGIEIDHIPTMYGMNRILKKIGWAAVAVDGFIPPGAFMEFTAYKVLVIAADIRTLEHIEYTPAPDIIHESAGHAPIIAHPDFAEYLINIGKVGAKAFSSQKDHELYEAIRHLSIIKEDPNTLPREIEEGEERIAAISSNMGKPSEMALLRNLHWWTVEYGLIGSVDDFRIYGAGLLSSIGESETCLRKEVKKIPYTIDAAYCNYDITRPQPQLFVTPDFAHLTTVLNEFASGMAFQTGGTEAVQKAVESQNTATLLCNTGLQVSGTFSEMITNEKNEPVYIKTSGPAAFAMNDKELKGHGKNTHQKGVRILPGKWKTDALSIGSKIQVDLPNGISLHAELNDILELKGEVLVVEIKNGEINYKGKILEKITGPVWCVLAETVTSAFAGPADIEAFQPTVNVPREKTHKIVYNSRTLKLHKLYRLVREIREKRCEEHLLPKIAQMIQKYFPDDWLLSLEILELCETLFPHAKLSNNIRNFLKQLKLRKPELNKLIDDGMKLIRS